VSPVKYELGFYLPEDDILHSHRRENLILQEIHDLFNDAGYTSNPKHVLAEE
jgi:hypothetical protein